MGCRRVRKAGKVLPLRFYFSVLRQWGKMPAPNPIFAKGSDIADFVESESVSYRRNGPDFEVRYQFFSKGRACAGRSRTQKRGRDDFIPASLIPVRPESEAR